MEMKITWRLPPFILVLSRNVLIAALVIPSALLSSSPIQKTAGYSTISFPIRAAFYYPWFPEAWDQSGLYPFTRYHPVQGYYRSDDPRLISNQISAMQYGKIQVGIASWWGQGHLTDKHIPLLLQSAEGTKFQWSLYMEKEGYGNPSVESIRSDLKYIQDQYASSNAYLKVDGKFVVFVYGGETESCELVSRWKEANDMGAYLVLKIFPGYLNCPQQPDAWHQYSPALAEKQVGGYSFSISPGFALAGAKTIRLPRDLDRWKKDIQEMTNSKSNFQLITTFNEWGEGTSVENALDWSSTSAYGDYLDALHWDGLSPTRTSIPVPAQSSYSKDYRPID